MKTLKQILIEIALTKTNKALLIKKYGEKSDNYLADLINRFEKFKNNLKEKDIFKYNSYDDIENAIELNSKTKTQNLKQGKNVKPIYEDDQYIVYNPQTHGESCEIGSDTEWCISMKKEPKHWNDYTSFKNDINFYIVIDKSKSIDDPLFKVAVAVYPNNMKEVYDEDDDMISMPNYPSRILNLFKPSTNKFKFYKLLDKENKTRDEIIFILDRLKIKNYKINLDLSVDVDVDVDLSSIKLMKIPVKFRYVDGDFDCSENTLISLESSPVEVSRDFSCSDNNLKSLKGAPKEVGGGFDCDNNSLTSLKDAPNEVGGFFSCRYNKKKFTEKEVEDICNVKGMILV